MTRTPWTKEELELLTTNLSNEEIVKETGRTFYGVLGMRKRLTGTTRAVVTEDIEIEPLFNEIPFVKESDNWTEEEKIYRIHSLAQRYGVRLTK